MDKVKSVRILIMIINIMIIVMVMAMVISNIPMIIKVTSHDQFHDHGYDHEYSHGHHLYHIHSNILLHHHHGQAYGHCNVYHAAPRELGIKLVFLSMTGDFNLVTFLDY